MSPIQLFARKELPVSLGIQPIHIVIIIVVALLIFGPKRLPDMGRSIGKALSEFRSGAKEMTDGFREEVSHPVTPQATSFTAQPSTFSVPNALTSSQTPIAVPAGRFCIQCGTSNLPESRFCSSCGAKLPELNIS
jgi:sec-independent protein translocase protein TatA